MGWEEQKERIAAAVLVVGLVGLGYWAKTTIDSEAEKFRRSLGSGSAPPELTRPTTEQELPSESESPSKPTPTKRIREYLKNYSDKRVQILESLVPFQLQVTAPEGLSTYDFPDPSIGKKTGKKFNPGETISGLYQNFLLTTDQDGQRMVWGAKIHESGLEVILLGPKGNNWQVKISFEGVEVSANELFNPFLKQQEEKLPNPNIL